MMLELWATDGVTARSGLQTTEERFDCDLGTYERFLDMDISQKNNMTNLPVYKTVD